MKITFFSDVHGLWKNLVLPQDSDMLIFGGDYMNSGYEISEVVDFLNWFSSQKSKYKLLTVGNHDRLHENMPSFTNSVLKEEHPDIIYLENSGVEIEGIKFWGSPNSKRFMGWAFNNTDEELERLFNFIPEDTDILVSHAPQYGIADYYHGEHIGEKTLGWRLPLLKNLKYHLVGHVHEGYGVYDKSTRYTTINGSLVDLNEYGEYYIKNKPITFDFE